jgi:hypothetical protein
VPAALITFDIPAFRVSFPAFADPTKYPDPTLQGYWDAATCYISDKNYGWLNGDCRARALNLMTAHLAALSTLINNGQPTGVGQSATIGAVSVSMVPPPVKSGWQYWLASTPYGMQLWALLHVKAVGGLSIGGLPEKSAFRKVAGIF